MGLSESHHARLVSVQGLGPRDKLFHGSEGPRLVPSSNNETTSTPLVPTCQRLSIHAAVRARGLSAGEVEPTLWCVINRVVRMSMRRSHLASAHGCFLSSARREASLKQISNISATVSLRSQLLRYLLPRDRAPRPRRH
jgi:hypothetical protein